ncbi:uncharacterized protein LOC132165036 [Corylus avellana]|uniref:uncharacterized protein LOC132165036 n=1 Tax=Corylus avellana TaxID=13451 RepID=UPI00286C95B2|nr:uncharacterized protein LOC132165036 [Corylus avellana]
MVIGFSDADYLSILHPHTDALVITLTVANHNVHLILVDNGSLADILYWSAFKKLNLGQEKNCPNQLYLMGFTGEQVQPVGSIELPVTARSYPRQATIMVRFLLVDRPSVHNAIIGRKALNELRAITSTPHLKVKFPTDHGVGEIRDLDEFLVNEPDRVIKIGSQLDPITKKELKSFLHSNCDLFAWSHDDMPEIAPSVMVHKLNANPKFKPVQQKRRGYSPENSRAATEEVEKLHEAGFIKEIQYTTWLANVVLVK